MTIPQFDLAKEATLFFVYAAHAFLDLKMSSLKHVIVGNLSSCLNGPEGFSGPISGGGGFQTPVSDQRATFYLCVFSSQKCGIHLISQNPEATFSVFFLNKQQVW